MKRTIIFIILGLLLVPIAQAQNVAGGEPQKPNQPADMGIFQSANIKWTDGPASLAPGAKIAVLEGDPTMDGFFTMRIWLPDGFRVAPHWHPKVEHVTVISGTFNLGMGEKFDQTTTREMPAGTFGFWPAGMKHFVWVKGDTVVQFHGIGPWTINYVNPSDDPRIKK